MPEESTTPDLVELVRAGSVVERQTNYMDIDEARVAAERLAEDGAEGRGFPPSRRCPSSGRAGRVAVSANLDLVRSIYADWERGNFTRSGWADGDVAFVRMLELEREESTGITGMVEQFRRWLSAWDDFHAVRIDEYRELDDERVLVLGRMSGRGKMSGVDVETEFANVLHLRDGKVTRLVLYPERDRAPTDLGLEG